MELTETCCCTNITTSVWRQGPTLSVLQKGGKKVRKELYGDVLPSLDPLEQCEQVLAATSDQD